MYCSTCGTRLADGSGVCERCGTSVLPAARPALGSRAMGGQVTLAACPRCSYHGEGIPYFSRGRHLAALVGVTVVSAGAMGVGGLVYYLLRRDHYICPRCGRSWGAMGELALLRTRQAAPQEQAGFPATAGREGMKRALSMLLFVFGLILLVAGIAATELAPALFGVAAVGGGFMLQRSASREREARREALIASLQGPVLKLAAERAGLLTVTDVAAHLGWTIRRAERVLHSLDDGLRVDSEVTDEGVIVYRFLEIGAIGAGEDEDEARRLGWSDA